MTKIIGLALVVAALLLMVSSAGGSGQDAFRFKWPYSPAASAIITTYPYQGVHDCNHECVDAWDVVISDNIVVSSAEGIPYEVTSGIPADSCYQSDHLGNHVKVEVPVAGDYVNVYYAHLTSTPVTQGTRILQGAAVGVQGHTGYTIGNEPGQHEYRPGGEGCGTHLHYQFTPAHPALIDNASNPSDSTNSIVGAYNAPGHAIQQKYWDLGNIGFGPSWGVVGWTADWTSNESGCGSVLYCRLYVHYAPNAVTGHWSSLQVFRLDPGAPVTDDGALMVGRWAVNDVYWVHKGLFGSWLYSVAGLPVMDEVSSSSGAVCGPGQCCSTSVGCTRY